VALKALRQQLYEGPAGALLRWAKSPIIRMCRARPARAWLKAQRPVAKMEFNQVRYFLTLADTLNFTRAAEACNVTQPALTRAIQKLEEELGRQMLAAHDRR
jgi:Bacterial regulatory helix-turn-helix protein, lysR family